MVDAARGIKSRTRSGCKTCRRRRLKCDEKRPVCNRCTSSQLVCDYSLQLVWEEDALSSGRCHGRAGVWSKSLAKAANQGGGKKSVPSTEVNTSQREVEATSTQDRTSLPLQFLNTTAQDMILYYRILKQMGKTQQKKGYEDLSVYNLDKLRTPSDTVFGYELRLSYFGHPQPALSVFPSCLSDDERTLIDYYKNVVCIDVTHIRRDTEHDPRQFFMWLATNSQAVYLGVLMVSASFLRQQNPNFGTIALKHRQRVLKALGGLLNEIRTRATEIFVLSMMLCSSAIQDACDPSWVTHLAVFNGMIVRRRQTLDTDYRNEYGYRLGWRYFGYHVVIAKTVLPAHALMPWNGPSCGSNGPDSWSSTANLALAMSHDTMDIIDTYSNISNRLLLLINEITELKTRAESGLTSSHSTGLEADNLQESVERIHQSLLNLQQIVPDFIQVTSPEWVENMQRSAEAARLAALILLHESLRPSLFSNRSPLPHPAFSTASDSVLDDNDKGVYIKAILDLVRDIMNYGPLPVSWPLWSLFIAGCCAADEVDRITVLRLFETALKKSNFGNIRPAFNVVQAVWNQRELEADDEVCARTKKRRLRRDDRVDGEDRYRGWYGWGKIMDKMGLKVSLA